MSINHIQFQPGLTLSEFYRLYGTEAKCYRAFYRWRWPHGFRCLNRPVFRGGCLV